MINHLKKVGSIAQPFSNTIYHLGFENISVLSDK
jgi:hypothetical protein